MSDAVIFAENDNFVSIGDFERSLSWGAEIEFEWKGVLYGVIRYGTDHKITIYQCGHPETEKVCETAEEALEYIREDEYVEVTPKSMRMRKIILDHTERKRANRD